MLDQATHPQEPPDAVAHSRAGQLKRLARIRGQIDGIGRMIEQERDCTDILAQTAAVRAALRALESVILQRHVDHCLRDALNRGEGAEEQLSELLRIFRKVTA